LVTGSEASESRLKAARGPSVVVLSTHGFFLADQSESPSLVALLLGGSGRTAPAEPKGDPLENPLTRCGLVLAGCNAVVAEDVFDATTALDDGILTGLEIVGCDLRGTGMVVLSACQTGLGDVRNGEGVAGLRQAFRLAGAKTVVATLWSIPDGDTADLITGLFTSLADGMDAARALRAAQVRAIKERREKYDAAHPHSWAAFTVTGR
jgi:CHAT domain-containing protein